MHEGAHNWCLDGAVACAPPGEPAVVAIMRLVQQVTETTASVSAGGQKAAAAQHPFHGRWDIKLFALNLCLPSISVCPQSLFALNSNTSTTGGT